MVRRYEGVVPRVHVDIIDGVFAPNTTISGIEELAAIETSLAFEVHLMVRRPADILADWHATRADRLIIHAEAEGDHVRMLMDMTEHGKQGILAFNPDTDTDRFETVIPHCRHVQFMTVNPGFYGSPFVESSIEKIADFHMRHKGTLIAVDGGVTPETAPKLVVAGASILVCGAYLADSQDVQNAIQFLKA